MQLKPEEISKVIRSQIKYYDNAIKQNETGTVRNGAEPGRKQCFYRFIWG